MHFGDTETAGTRPTGVRTPFPAGRDGQADQIVPFADHMHPTLWVWLTSSYRAMNSLPVPTTMGFSIEDEIGNGLPVTRVQGPLRSGAESIPTCHTECSLEDP